MPHTGHLVVIMEKMCFDVTQHAHRLPSPPPPPLAAPNLGPHASSGRARGSSGRLWAPPTLPVGQAGPLSAEPLPRVLELAASQAAELQSRRPPPRFGSAGHVLAPSLPHNYTRLRLRFPGVQPRCSHAATPCTHAATPCIHAATPCTHAATQGTQAAAVCTQVLYAQPMRSHFTSDYGDAGASGANATGENATGEAAAAGAASVRRLLKAVQPAGDDSVEASTSPITNFNQYHDSFLSLWRLTLGDVDYNELQRSHSHVQVRVYIEWLSGSDGVAPARKQLSDHTRERVSWCRRRDQPASRELCSVAAAREMIPFHARVLGT